MRSSGTEAQQTALLSPRIGRVRVRVMRIDGRLKNRYAHAFCAPGAPYCREFRGIHIMHNLRALLLIVGNLKLRL